MNHHCEKMIEDEKYRAELEPASCEKISNCLKDEQVAVRVKLLKLSDFFSAKYLFKNYFLCRYARSTISDCLFISEGIFCLKWPKVLIDLELICVVGNICKRHLRRNLRDGSCRSCNVSCTPSLPFRGFPNK